MTADGSFRICVALELRWGRFTLPFATARAFGETIAVPAYSFVLVRCGARS